MASKVKEQYLSSDSQKPCSVLTWQQFYWECWFCNVELTISPEMLQNYEKWRKNKTIHIECYENIEPYKINQQKQNLREFWHASLPSPLSPHEIVCLFCKQVFVIKMLQKYRTVFKMKIITSNVANMKNCTKIPNEKQICRRFGWSRLASAKTLGDWLCCLFLQFYSFLTYEVFSFLFFCFCTVL